MDRRVGRVIELIASDLSDDQSLDGIAHEVNLSASRLRHLFKAEMGLTPQQFRKHARLRKATELAAETFLSVKQIREQVGICEKTHFARDFKRLHGRSLRQLRAHINSADQHRRVALGAATADYIIDSASR